jgi:hypothetical protein
MPNRNALAQARWRERNNAFATVGRAQLGARKGSRRAKLEAEHLQASAAWTRQLTLLADARAYFGRLKDAPPGQWASEERAEALTRMHFHESTARALDTLLKSYERELKTFERHEESLATARRHLVGHRGKR